MSSGTTAVPAVDIAPPDPPARRSVLVLFAATSVLTASLLFVVQPMVTRMVLPAFGGSPQVWTTSMLFFQVALLVGYGYSHVATTRLDRRRQPWVHVVLLALPVALLPIALTVAPSGRDGLAPSLELLAALTIGVAAPFVLLATSGPLLQRWFSWTDHPHAGDPYVLYAAGNVGSIGGLLAYPFLLERVLSVTAQARWWTVGYAAALVLVGACAVVATRHRADDPPGDGAARTLRPEPSPPVGRRRAARWIALAFVPSSAMLAVSSYLSTDIAAVPMLWVLPLAIYLATFVVAFGRWSVPATRVATWLAVPVAVAALTVTTGLAGVTGAIAVQLGLVAVTGLVAHGRLSADRPPPTQLTRFYVLLAVGGALGGVANGILAPLLLPVVFEHGLIVAALVWLVVDRRSPLRGAATWSPAVRVPVGMVIALVPATLFLLSAIGGMERWVSIVTLVAAVVLVALPTTQGGAIAIGVTCVALLPGLTQIARADLVERTFFGVHRVQSDADHVVLMHGTTTHGAQDLSTPEERREPLTYYARSGPVGDLDTVFGDRGDIGVVGLGTGAIASYGRSDQRVVFHEIDPAVVPIAWERFTYLGDSAANVEVVLGDGRLTVADVQGRYGLLAIDAFSSDSIPVHLLTVEAVEGFLPALTDDGVLALHLSNRYLRLLPVAAGAAEALGLDLVVRFGEADERASAALWVALAPPDGRLDALRDLGWEDVDDQPRPWTDQRSDLWSVVRR